jgi:hypothetical protein
MKNKFCSQSKLPNKLMETQLSTTNQSTNIAPQSMPVTSLFTPIAYAISAVIVLAGLGAFLGQLFRLGKD